MDLRFLGVTTGRAALAHSSLDQNMVENTMKMSPIDQISSRNESEADSLKLRSN